MTLLRFRLALLAACAAAAVAAAGAAAQRARSDRHVVLITIDGFAADDFVNPRLPLPNLRHMAEAGAQAEGMQVVTPSVTWPNHTTLVTGVYPAKHGVLANGLIEPNTIGRPMTVNPRRSKDELCRFPTIYDLAHDAGMTTGEVDWPVTRDAKSLDWRFPDHPDPVRYTTPALLKELQQLWILPQPTDAAFSAMGPLSRDYVWAKTAVHLIRTRRPNFLLLHLLLSDGIQHKRGPQTDEAYAALALADRYAGDVLQAVREAGIQDRTTVFVTADHGFAKVTKTVNLNARFRNAGLIHPGEDGKSTDYDAFAIPEGGVAYVYVPKGIFKPDHVQRTRAALNGIDGVDRVLTPAEYTQLGMPAPNRNPQAPDFLVTAKDTYAFGGAESGEEVVRQDQPTGSHGYLATNPKMDAFFVASGAGIKKGVKLKRIHNVDVAPTIARLLGLTVSDVDGHALELLLEPSSR